MLNGYRDIITSIGDFMKYCSFKQLLVGIIFLFLNINPMEKITKSTDISTHEEIVKLKKEKNKNKYLIVEQIYNSVTHELSWRAYLKIIITNRYAAIYKYSTEIARNKWNKLTQKIDIK